MAETNRFSGQVVLENKDTGERKVAQLDFKGLDQTSTIVVKAGKSCSAGASVELKSSGGFQNCGVSAWGTVACTEEDFWSGQAHQEVIEHLLDQIVPVIDHLEHGWIPEGKIPVRVGFSEGEGFTE